MGGSRAYAIIPNSHKHLFASPPLPIFLSPIFQQANRCSVDNLGCAEAGASLPPSYPFHTRLSFSGHFKTTPVEKSYPHGGGVFTPPNVCLQNVIKMSNQGGVVRKLATPLSTTSETRRRTTEGRQQEGRFCPVCVPCHQRIRPVNPMWLQSITIL